MSETLSDIASAAMYVIAISLVLIIGLTLAVFAYDGLTLVKKWNNICLLEVGKAYGKYGFTYYVPIEMQPGEYITETTYMALVKPNINNKLPAPKNSRKYGSGYYVPYQWANSGEVRLVSNSFANGLSPYPNGIPSDYYPSINRECPSLAYLDYNSIGTDPNLNIPDKSGGILYYLSVVPIKMSDNEQTSVLTTVPTKNIVFIKFYPSGTYGVANMQRVGVVQIGKTPNLLPEYIRWLPTPTNFVIQQLYCNKNLVVFWGKDGKYTELYKS